MKIIGKVAKWNQGHLYLNCDQGDFYVSYDERQNLQNQSEGIPPISTFVGIEVEAECELYNHPIMAYSPSNVKAVFIGHTVLGSVKIIKENV